MPRRSMPTETPIYIPGDFAEVAECEYTLTTASGTYRLSMGSYSGPSITEKRYVTVQTAEGKHVTSFDYIRKYLKRGLRCNVTGFEGFDTEPKCIEAMSRHYVARHEARLARRQLLAS